ncbi:MAG: hypothetical protein HOF74_00305 [Gammaproteobacteria bacterium]|jgi:hypothetical protein|nr:hypothetical protein [Gammaproteobacteria bacterium]MBT3858248.1 hypothetical protein [Gammaproteobacteria bacterium]MBT3988629.1 hypothetical protein [Gammaproteobacteria bacterium]MBT4256484.1 hypothetical protein [Gammaproteobacteria bacterium]MBT4580433.1 hypothetical protein [Gammaproteobacteria bacterium]
MSHLNQIKVASALLGLSFAIGSSLSLAQDASRPDLTGIWTNASLTGLSRPRGVEDLIVSPEVAQEIAANTSIAGIAPGDFDESAPTNAADGAPPAGSIDFGLRGYNSFWTDPGTVLAMVKGEFRTSYIVDPPNGRIPRLESPNSGFERRGFGSRYLTGVGGNTGPEDMPLAERCLLGFGNTAGPGMMGTLYNSTYQFVQTDDYVLVSVEMVHDARIIPTFDSAEEARANRRPSVLKPWLGDSVGWYEDGTLVVETVNINPAQMAESSVPITDDGRITERFSKYSETEIFYSFTVEDPNIYIQPWTAELSFHATDGQMYEYACHEGNYAMPGILAGARRLEAEEAAK